MQEIKAGLDMVLGFWLRREVLIMKNKITQAAAACVLAIACTAAADTGTGEAPAGWTLRKGHSSNVWTKPSTGSVFKSYTVKSGGAGSMAMAEKAARQIGCAISNEGEEAFEFSCPDRRMMIMYKQPQAGGSASFIEFSCPSCDEATYDADFAEIYVTGMTAKVGP
jgi:hypothetical protein